MQPFTDDARRSGQRPEEFAPLTAGRHLPYDPAGAAGRRAPGRPDHAAHAQAVREHSRRTDSVATG